MSLVEVVVEVGVVENQGNGKSSAGRVMVVAGYVGKVGACDAGTKKPAGREPGELGS